MAREAKGGPVVSKYLRKLNQFTAKVKRNTKRK